MHGITGSLKLANFCRPPQSTPSIRDWQRSMESNGEFHNAYHRDTTGMHASYQMQQVLFIDYALQHHQVNVFSSSSLLCNIAK